jgi:signal transduction histidine kinase
MLTEGAELGEYLEWLTRIGFDRCRYYELTTGTHEELVLATEAGHCDEHIKGLRIPLAESSLAVSGSFDRPVHDIGLTADSRPHVHRLGLVGRHWIEVPVKTATRLEGILACDWELDDIRPPPSDADMMFLLFLGKWLADVVRFRPLATGQAEEHSSVRTTQDDRLDEGVKALLDGARLGTAAATVSAFAYDWQSGRLSKIYESVDPRLIAAAPRNVHTFPEVYLAGEHFTGRAWLHPDERYIPNFEKDIHRGRVPGGCERSQTRHEILFRRPVNSILYERCGTLSTPLLIRFLNRVDYPHLTFESRRETAAQFARSIGALVDQASIRRVLRSLTHVGGAASLGTLDLDVFRHRLAQQLDALDIRGVCYVMPTPDGVEVWSLDYQQRMPTSEASYLGVDPPPFSTAPRIVRREEIGEIVAALPTDADAYLLLCTESPLPLQLLFPLEMTKQASDSVLVLEREERDLEEVCAISWFELKFCVFALELLSFAHSAARFYSTGTSYGIAFLRFLHHEVMGTANRLADVAEQTFEHVDRQLRRATKERSRVSEVLDLVESERNELTLLRTEMNRALRPVVLMVQPNSSVNLRFEDCEVAALVSGAVAELKERLSDEFLTRYGLHPATVTASMPPELWKSHLNCDRFAVQRALVSLLDNAVKYSNPRHYPGLGSAPVNAQVRLGRGRGDARRCRVDLTASIIRGARLLEFAVTNWGAAPPTTDSSFLFRAFERGGVRDPRRRVPGLGVGLFVVATCAEMHLGQARLESRSTLSDPSRIGEGHETRALLRLSLELRQGDFQWSRAGGLVALPEVGRR